MEPFENFSLWRNVCQGQGQHLWARWHNSKSFVLEGYVISRPNHSKMTKTYYETPSFTSGLEDVWLLDDTGPNPQGIYEIEMQVIINGVSRVINLNKEVSNSFYQGTPLINFIEAKKGDFSSVIATIKPSFNGSIRKIIVYGSDGCYKNTKLYYSEPILLKGHPQDVDLGAIVANRGEKLLLTIEGVKDDINYTYYTTIEIIMPSL